MKRSSFRATIKQGVALYNQDKYLDAKKLFDSIVRALSPRKKPSENDTEILSDAYYHLGLCYGKLNNTAEALNSFSKAIESSPYDADPYYHRSLIYSQMNQYQSALNDLSSAIRHNPDYTEAYFDRANINFLSGRFKDVLADCEKGLAIEPVSPYFNILRAMTYELLGRYKDAVIDCNTALKIFRDEDRNEAVMLYTVRGRSYAVAGEFGRALTDFNKLIGLTSQDAMAYFYRGVIYANMEVLDKAIADFRKGLELKPSDVNITDSLLQAEREVKAKDLQKRLKKKETKIARAYKKSEREEKYEAEINQLKGEIKTIKELLIEIVRPKPEYSIPLPSKPQWSPDNFGMPEMGIFRIPVRPSIIMPIPEKPNK
ncbi:MAG: tetratricopeptide repeat protein [Planctomycetes bacterium]|nr:tetratricopeptide repeat protein [Planctomycetota bacterium]